MPHVFPRMPYDNLKEQVFACSYKSDNCIGLLQINKSASINIFVTGGQGKTCIFCTLLIKILYYLNIYVY